MSYYFFHKMQLIQEGTSDKLSKKFLPGDYCVMVSLFRSHSLTLSLSLSFVCVYYLRTH